MSTLTSQILQAPHAGMFAVRALTPIVCVSNSKIGFRLKKSNEDDAEPDLP